MSIFEYLHRHRKLLVLAASGLAVSVLIGIAYFRKPEASPEKILSGVYSKFDEKHKCWIGADEDGQLYCMRLDRFDRISTSNGERLYVIAVGEAVDEQGEPNGAHVTSGAVGAFVVQIHSGKSELVAGEATIQVGAMGVAPAKWNFVKLGPDDYWGWLNTWGDCHQGSCGQRYSILAPRGKKVVDLAGFVSEADDTGSCGDVECEKQSSSLTTSLKISDKANGAKVYSLFVTVRGKDHGKPLKEKTWMLPFDRKSWHYVEPKDWPLNDRDF
jgi:hypothetical protein